jgi:hypothetical protein
MRNLARPPARLFDPGGPRFGSYKGGLPELDLGPTGRGGVWNRLHKKRWTYAAVADENVIAAAAIVHLGYASTALAYALDRRTGRLLFDRSVLAPPSAASFTDGGSGKRSATFRTGGVGMFLGDESVTVDFADADRPFHVGARASARASSPPAIGAVVPIDGGYANATEKRLLDAEGEVVAQGMRFILKEPHVALDHTAGYLARQTTWRWALGFGRTSDGARVGFNVVQGFVGEAECAAWVGDTLVPLGEGRFTHGDPRSPWRVETTCGALEVLFRPAAVHREDTDLGVVRSRFVQPVGTFEGTLKVGGETLSLSRMPGVTEHQDVLW